MSYFDDNEDRIIYGARRRPRNTWTATCKRCGMTGLKWRDDGDQWRLYENKRMQYNRLKPHVCNGSGDVADDFDAFE
jgi:hypothetical protein